MSRRRPRPRLVRGPSPLPGLVVATVGVALAAAWVQAPAGGAAPGGVSGAVLPIDAAVRRLRAAVVGDVDAERGAGAERALRGRAAGEAGGPRDRGPLTAARAAVRRSADAHAARRAAAGRAADRGVTYGVPWWADSAHWGPEVIRWREATRAPLVVDAGDTVLVAGPDIPALLPDVLRRRGVHWTADGPALVVGGAADAEGGRRVVAGVPGVASVTAATAAGRTVTPIRVRAVLRGCLFAADGGAAPGARVVVALRDAPGPPLTIWTDAAGRFRAPLPDGWGGRADVLVEPLDGYSAVQLAGVPAARLHTLGVVLLPARYAPAAGPHAGAAVPVRADLARGFWRFAAPAVGGRRPVGWADDAPRTVAFEAGLGGAPPADTAAFWAAARALGTAWGRPLFRPAAGDPAGADVTVRVTPGLAPLGLTTLGYGADGGTIGGARVEFRTPAAAADPRVVAHELLHALGFGHARGWPSVLAGTGAWGAPAPTAADVAYGQLFEGLRRAARRAEREYGAGYGWNDAVP